MTIRFVILEADLLVDARAGISALKHAVDVGDMDGVDAATAGLAQLTATCRSIELSEEEWRGFLAEVRSVDPAFSSDYLLSGGVCAQISPMIAIGDLVLQLPISGDAQEAGDV